MRGNLNLYACLPFVEIAKEATIQIGPVLFWPSSKHAQHLPLHLNTPFQTYLSNIKLASQPITCVSISDEIPIEDREAILIDSIYLLYFACTFRNLYYNAEVPHFSAFLKVIPASESFLSSQVNVESITLEPGVCIHLIDQEICHGLGIALNEIYVNQSHPMVDSFKRLIRAIRYFVDCFFERFVNLVGLGLDFPQTLFEAEDIIFLASSFESLLDISTLQPSADFKHKMRPMLHLKYSHPLEIFWKWVDGFYDLHKQIVHGGDNPDPIFKGNRNFHVPYIFVGMKLFIYTIYYMLFKYKLIESKEIDLFSPPDFKCIHPQELLLFFWTEDSLIRKISLALLQAADPQHQKEAVWLAELFQEMFIRYYRMEKNGVVRFIPVPKDEFDREARIVSDHAAAGATLPDGFLVALRQRLAG